MRLGAFFYNMSNTHLTFIFLIGGPLQLYIEDRAWTGGFADTSPDWIALANTLVDAFTDTELDADTQTRRYGEGFDAAGGQLGCAL